MGVIWLTGLSGSGKTTLANRVAEYLVEAGHKVQVLDGDDIRKSLCEDLGFSKEDRIESGRRAGFVARMLAKHGVTVLVAAISPYVEQRAEQRHLALAEGFSFTEVHVHCPLVVLYERDTKGMYKRAFNGELEHFTGVSAPYEVPTTAEVVVHTELESVEESAKNILRSVINR